MDDARLPFQIATRTLPGVVLSDADVPADFVPLRLLVQPGGLCFELTRAEMLLGRHSQVDIRVCLPDVSRRHCRFVFHEGHWQVFDLHSLNGVFVNGARVEEATLCPEDVLRVGSVTFKVQLAPAASHQPARILPGPAPQRKAS